MSRRPAPRGAKPADGVWGHRRSGARRKPREHRTGPPEGEAERESARAGRRRLGASEERSAAQAARAPDGPPGRGGRARERSSRPTASGGIGGAERGASRASTGRAPRKGRPSARALEPADGVWGHRRSGARRKPREHRTGPPEGEAERESARAGRRRLGASEERSAAQAARAPDGPPGRGGRARERSSRPTASGGIGGAERGASRASTGRAPRKGRPSARALEPADGVWGHRRSGARRKPREHRTGPPEGEAERESARAGRRRLGASEERSAAQAARAPDGPPGRGGRARERSSRPTASGGIGGAERGASRASTGRAPRKGRPSARALEPADGVWGHRRSGARRKPREHRTGPPEGEAERESARAGRRRLG